MCSVDLKRNEKECELQVRSHPFPPIGTGAVLECVAGQTGRSTETVTPTGRPRVRPKWHPTSYTVHKGAIWDAGRSRARVHYPLSVSRHRA